MELIDGGVYVSLQCYLCRVLQKKGNVENRKLENIAEPFQKP
jgi:hypothetical protein